METRDAGFPPLVYSGCKRFQRGLYGHVEVAEEANKRGADPAPIGAINRFDRRVCFMGHGLCQCERALYLCRTAAPDFDGDSVRVRDGKRLVTDGPFAQTREQLGGYYLIEARDLDEAIGIAELIPVARVGTIEVRPVLEIPGLPTNQLRRAMNLQRQRQHISKEELQVRKIVVNISLTLDGVMQAPGRPDEDLRGGFEHGGWSLPYFDPIMLKAAGEGMATMPALLFGRRTYEDFFAVWPKRTDDNPFTEALNNLQKYVASRTLKDPLPWSNSTLLTGDAAAAVATLKQQPGKDLVVLGSGELVQSLMRRNLVDEYALSIHPLVLGSGRRLFPDGSPFAALRLVDTKTTTTGVVIATYRPAEPTAGEAS